MSWSQLDGHSPRQLDRSEGQRCPRGPVQAVASNVTAQRVSHKLVCYLTNWAHRRPGMASIAPKDLDPLLCTHLIFAFASMENNQLVAKTARDEAVFYPEFNRLKERNQRLKTLLSVGGWDFGTERFTTMLSTATRRGKFIESVISLLRTYNFDGLDLFFLYPGLRGSPLHDRWNFLFLIEELLFAFRREATIHCHPRLLLSAAVSGAPHIIHRSYDVRFLGRYLDFINILSYDFHGSWEGVTGHNSPLYSLSGDPKSSAFAINYWRKLGAPSEKLIMGLPTYGRTFCLLKDSEARLGAKTTGPGLPGKYTKQAGFLAYFEICSFVRQAKKSWIDNQFVPYASKGKAWVGYDDAASFTYKAMFIKTELFGGAMVWTLDLDDAKGTFCGNGPFPLVRILSNLLLNDGGERVATESHRHYENTMPGETVTPGRETMTLGEHNVTLEKKRGTSEEMATSPVGYSIVMSGETNTSPVGSSMVTSGETDTSPVGSSAETSEELTMPPVDSLTVTPEGTTLIPVNLQAETTTGRMTSVPGRNPIIPEKIVTPLGKMLLSSAEQMGTLRGKNSTAKGNFDCPVEN
ncbi:oviduct-specific glycoprotein [Echinops telfairi]|uniref:Oviduct-specific glycoprotein n=1 Tax=Echinops telfairi TaxID=9371 RepID=A0ABM1VKF6_ECHTE|nr:oviduct-specific glycoprotein [Echinops telfairi]